MFLVFVLGFLCATAAEESEVQQQACNCTRTLQGEEATTDPPPAFPSTSFTCWGRFDGYYADVEVDCTIFHYCQTWQFPSGLNETVKWDFACPQSTIFNQRVLSCTPPNNSFDCQESPNYFWVNYNLTSSSTTVVAPTLPPIPDLSTPVSNVGQQLIVGEIEAQSANFEDSSDSPHYTEQSTTNPFVSETPIEFPPGSDQPPTVSEGIESDGINFPI